MNKLALKLICLVLALAVMVMSDSALASICNCLGFQTNQHACCQDKQPPCHHGEGKQSLKALMADACDCSISAPDNLGFQDDVQKRLLESSQVFQMAAPFGLSPLVANGQKPVWLRRIYYPDKSSLFLDSQHLLL